MPADPKALKAAALDYAARGWRVIPLHTPFTHSTTPGCSCPRRGACRTPGKHPRFVGWRSLATTDPATISTWWRHFPHANVGIATGGLAGLVVVDVDGETGRASLAKLAIEHGELPETLRQSTGRTGGGTHHVFCVEVGQLDWLRNRTQIAPGIDLRSEGGLIVAAPSAHPSGAQYAWENDHDLAPFPAWLGKLTRSAKARQATFATSGSRPDENLVNTIWPLAKRLELAEAALEHAEPAIERQNGSRACLRAAIIVVRGYLVPVEGGHACDLLMRAYNPRCRPPWDEYEMIHKINSAAVGVDIPWGYRLATVPGPEDWDLRPGAPSWFKRQLLAAAAGTATTSPPDLPPLPPAPKIAPAISRPNRPRPPASGAALLWTPHPIDLSAAETGPQDHAVEDDEDRCA